MKKFEKILTIILICLLVALGIAILVLYFVDKELLKEFYHVVVDFINRPLPIIGVTTATVLVFLWKLIITSNYGKKQIGIYNEKVNEIDQAKENFINDANSTIKELESEIEKLREQLASACELSTNKKIKDFGKGLEYGETTNSETTKE